MKPETIAAQALQTIDHATGAIVPPIQLATTYARDAHYKLLGPGYTRDENPTPVVVEQVIAALEGGAAALAFSSGMAAATAAIRALVRPGDHVVGPAIGYFALRGWLVKFCTRWGVDLDLVDASDTDAMRAAIRPGRTKLVWIETPANPQWSVADIAAIATLAHAAGALLAVDSTCATPVLTQPIALGADLVMHSATKYIGGHSDALCGLIVAARRDATLAAIAELRHDEGPCVGPFDAFLVGRGMRTLHARVKQQSATALALAERLRGLPGLTVRYPGLDDHPQHALAVRQMRGGFGGMLSIQLGSRERALAMIARLRLWLPATSLGGVESLVEHRATVEGPDTPTPPDLLRLSVGLEHPDDLFDDLAQAVP